ncbi:MAG TPA: HNH endonuclease, partial [Candidatus Binatia bacterium]|nr:HNH endonuclease [Candidatus Binatia bacterium]
ELVEAATHRSKRDVESMIGARFPEALPEASASATIRRVAPAPVTERAEPALLFDPICSDVPCREQSLLGPISTPSTGDDAKAGESVSTRHKLRSPGNVKFDLPPEDSEGETCSTPVETSNEAQPAPGRPADVRAPSERFLVRLTIARATHDKLREAQALLSHAVAPGDVAEVLDRALDLLLVHLRKRKVGSGRRERPRSSGHLGGEGRHIPAEIRRAVWERDEGRCTFVSAEGHRCAERGSLEFDHIEPAARGGKATVENVRLLCRAHNQLEAERAFGPAFMNRKRRKFDQNSSNIR